MTADEGTVLFNILANDIHAIQREFGRDTRLSNLAKDICQASLPGLNVLMIRIHYGRAFSSWLRETANSRVAPLRAEIERAAAGNATEFRNPSLFPNQYRLRDASIRRVFPQDNRGLGQVFLEGVASNQTG